MKDISVPFAEATPEWPGDTPCSCGWASEMTRGASVNVSRWTTSPHVGTHADAPLHVAMGGAGADQLPIEPFLGEAQLVDVTGHRGELSLAALRGAGLRSGTVRLLLRTGRSVAAGSFPEEWPWVAPEAAEALARGGLRLLAVDCPSVDGRESKTLDVHHALFGNGAYVLENLDLRGVAAGAWFLFALPLAVGAVDAAPVRAFLRPLTTR